MSTTTTATQSYHLPDLLGTISSLSLRTNRHCQVASQTAERRVHDSILPKNSPEAEWLSSMKVGLLMALCFPTCDMPQLALLAEAGLCIVIAGMRTAKCPSIREDEGRIWKTLEGEQNLDMLEGLDIMKRHELLQHLCHNPQLQRLTLKASTYWKDRFKDTLRSYCIFQRRVLLSSPGTIPDLEQYILTRREIFGNNILFELAELLEVFSFPEFLQDVQRKNLEKMKVLAFDINSWSIDIASYHNVPTSFGYNLITVLITHKHLSVQGAMNLAGSMIKEAFTLFCKLENELIESMQPKPSSVSTLFSFFDWSERPTMHSTDPDESRSNEDKAQEVKRYIRALEDCIVGSVHWLYETELFFGKKGGEVRTFGWVFSNACYAGLGTSVRQGESP